MVTSATNNKAIVILSGGLDSTTLLYDVKRKKEVVGVLSFNYGQRHKKELEYAQRTCEKLGLEHRVVDLSPINALVQGSSLTSDIDVPEGHYAEETMKSTVVPNRNMIMLSIATGYAVSKGAENVFFGAHGGDHDIYPDCRKEFVAKLSAATKIANYTPVKIHAPYLKYDKGDIAALGLRIHVPYEDTWTCYKGLERPCLKCGACVERCEAFVSAGTPDPLLMAGEWEDAKANLAQFKAAAGK